MCRNVRAILRWLPDAHKSPPFNFIDILSHYAARSLSRLRQGLANVGSFFKATPFIFVIGAI